MTATTERDDLKAACAVAGCGRPFSAKGFCKQHYERHRLGKSTDAPLRTSYRDVPLEERLRMFTELDPSGCVIFTGALHNGYGSIKVGGRTLSAHRVVYELLVGPVPAGLELDHLCHTLDETCRGGRTCVHRRCVNPAHLEPVTHAENTLRGHAPHAVNARKTHCKRGHEFTAENTHVHPDGRRECRACRPIRWSAQADNRRRGVAA